MGPPPLMQAPGIPAPPMQAPGIPPAPSQMQYPGIPPAPEMQAPGTSPAPGAAPVPVSDSDSEGSDGMVGPGAMPPHSAVPKRGSLATIATFNSSVFAPPRMRM